MTLTTPRASATLFSSDDARRLTTVPGRGTIREPWKTLAGTSIPANPDGGVFDGFLFFGANQ